MTSCSLVAPGLVPNVGGAVPTFSYRRTAHEGDYFGVQMTYLNGQSTCYQPGPVVPFTPVIKNQAAGYTVQCQYIADGPTSTGIYCPASVTSIPDGVLTITYINQRAGQPTPIPFLATFGPSPVARAVTVNTGTVATSTSTSTFTVSPAGFASTATVVAAAPTSTVTNTIIVTRTGVTTKTNYVSSCASPPVASSSSSATPSPVASSALATPSGFANSCPTDDGKLISTSAGTFKVTCNYDRIGITTGPFRLGGGLLGCVNLCANTSGCLYSSLYYMTGDCYLKFGPGLQTFNFLVYGAELVTPAPSAAAVPTSSPAVSSSVPAASREPNSSVSSSAAAASSALPLSIPVPSWSSTAAARPASSVGASSSPAAPSASASGFTCPGDNGEQITVGTKIFQIICQYDRAAITTGPFFPGGGLTGCATLCANTDNCLWSTYFDVLNKCFLKFGPGLPVFNILASSLNWINQPGASPVDVSSASASTSASSTAAISSSTPTASRSSTAALSSSSPAASPSSSSAAAPSTPATSTPSSATRTSSSAGVAPSSSSASSAAAPTATYTSVSCPEDNGKSVNTGAGAFIIECYVDRADGNLATVYPDGGFSGCIQACAKTSNCIDVSYSPNGPCYLKSAQGTPNTNNGIWGARLGGSSPPSVASGSSATSSAASSGQASTGAASSGAASTTGSGATATSSGPAATASVVCPGSDGQTISTSKGPFVVECGIDRADGDMSQSPVYPGSYENCVAACAARDGCVDVSYVNGACYLKSVAGTPNQKGGVIGGRLVSGPSSSGAASASSGTTSASGGSATGASLTGASTTGASISGASATSGAPATGASSSSASSSGASSTGASASSGASLAAATSPAATSGAGTPVQTVTVTTTIGGTGYQCACTPTGGLASGAASSGAASTPTPSAAPGASLHCPASDGSVYTSPCGATYKIECYSDRYGADISGGTSYVNSLDQCIADCDSTNGCIDVSYSPGSPGPCYKKSSAAAIRQNDNIFGALQQTGCTNTKLKLHRKRVVRSPLTPKKKVIQKRGAYGPDFTYTQGTSTVTLTTTSTSVRFASFTTTLSSAGITTTTVFTTPTATAVVTNAASIVQTQQVTITTCPTPAVTLF